MTSGESTTALFGKSDTSTSAPVAVLRTPCQHRSSTRGRSSSEGSPARTPLLARRSLRITPSIGMDTTNRRAEPGLHGCHGRGPMPDSPIDPDTLRAYAEDCAPWLADALDEAADVVDEVRSAGPGRDRCPAKALEARDCRSPVICGKPPYSPHDDTLLLHKITLRPTGVFQPLRTYPHDCMFPDLSTKKSPGTCKCLHEAFSPAAAKSCCARIRVSTKSSGTVSPIASARWQT